MCLTAVGAFAFIGFTHRWVPLSARYPVQKMINARSEVAFPGPALELVDGFPTHRAGPQRIMLIGDSNMEQYYPRIEELLTRDPEHNKTAVFASGGGCPPMPGVHEEHHHYCEGLVSRAIAYARKPEVATIIIAAAWNNYFYDIDPRYSYYFSDGQYKEYLAADTVASQRAFRAFEAMIESFVKQGKEVYIVLQIPVGKGLDPRLMIQRELGSLTFNVVAGPVKRSDVNHQLAPTTAKLVEIANRHGVGVIDPLDTLCNEEECPTVEPDGSPIYRDEGHLLPSYVRAKVRYLDYAVRADRKGPGGD
jgi:hypothetical protein